ncbi:unnamed protein product [Orchesella dallaii]|uniref:DNA-directed RNA polymerase subunit n=1 Tax=Orchesella dallaii TaxID=48710 RepID=A0ABP1Q732_9HEXA
MDKKFKFCPTCGNLLCLKCASSKSGSSGEEWVRKCKACPYVQPILSKHRYPSYIGQEGEGEEADIVESSKADEYRQRTEVLCPKCSHMEAFFYQMQTRSADEPMTTFYECCNKQCKLTWRE